MCVCELEPLGYRSLNTRVPSAPTTLPFQEVVGEVLQLPLHSFAGTGKWFSSLTSSPRSTQGFPQVLS